MKILIAQINPIIGAFDTNVQKILAAFDEGRERGADLVLLPELAICGYPPEDLLVLPSFIDGALEALEKVIAGSKGIAAIVGAVRRNPTGGEKGLYNTAAFIQDGALVGFQDKALLPDYDVFSERRYFEPAHQCRVWSFGGKRIAITICEDIWQHAEAVEYSRYLRDPILELKEHHPELLFNLSASPFYQKRYQTRLEVGKRAAQTLGCPVLLCNQVGGNDSLIFDGYSLYISAKGELLRYGKPFEEELFLVDTERAPPPTTIATDPITELYQALVLGVRDYFHKLGFTKACFGLSGGIDSAVVAVIAAEALGKENLLPLALPSRYSSKESVTDAALLAQNLGLTLKEIPIEGPYTAFMELLEPHFRGLPSDQTEENLQARIRGILLMAFSNKFGYLLLGTGNKSEMAMGYATLYGDMCGGLGVLSDVSKLQVYALAESINREKEIIPRAILDKPPSAELRPNQRDSDTLPPYPILDTVLGAYVEEHRSVEEIAAENQIDLPLVKDLVRKIHLNEYKRQQAPPGLRVTKKAFTAGRRFPIVQQWNMQRGS